MQEIAQEILTIKQMYKKAIESQKQNFQLELENVKRKVEQLESEN